jgi:O-antigen ligase
VLFSRLEPWQFARDTFLESPWVGIGFGVTSEREVMIVEANQLRAVKIEQGSSFWAVLSQVGLAGFVPISIALFNVLGRGLYFAYKVRDPYFSVLVASACGAMVNSIFEGWMVSPGSGLLWFTMMNCFVIDAVTSEFRPPAKRRRAAPAIQTIVPRPRALTPAQSATSRIL